MKHTQHELGKHARKAIKKGRRRDAKCDRRSLQRNLKNLARNFDGVSVVNAEGRAL